MTVVGQTHFFLLAYLGPPSIIFIFRAAGEHKYYVRFQVG
jgi:hypothetical protein